MELESSTGWSCTAAIVSESPTAPIATSATPEPYMIVESRRCPGFPKHPGEAGHEPQEQHQAQAAEQRLHRQLGVLVGQERTDLARTPVVVRRLARDQVRRPRQSQTGRLTRPPTGQQSNCSSHPPLGGRDNRSPILDGRRAPCKGSASATGATVVGHPGRAASTGRACAQARPRGPPMPWRSASPASSRSTVPPKRLLGGALEPGELALDRRDVLGQHRLAQLEQHRPQPADDLDRRRAVLADLGHAEREVVLPALRGHDDAQPALVVVELPAPVEAGRRTDQRERVLEVVEHLRSRSSGR